MGLNLTLLSAYFDVVYNFMVAYFFLLNIVASFSAQCKHYTSHGVEKKLKKRNTIAQCHPFRSSVDLEPENTLHRPLYLN